MKVELALLSLILIVSCSAQSYELKCTEKEKDILWPVYENNALYTRCADIGKPLEMKCNAGTVFTFVYQGCVLPDDYIPPPPKDSLPLDAGIPCEDGTTAAPTPGPTPSTKPPLILPTPQHPPPGPPPTEKPSTEPPTPKPPKTTTTTTESPPTAPGPPTGNTPAPPTGGPPAPPTGGPPTPARPTAGPGIPGPPSPPATGVPMPNTPAPTPPVIDNSPPSVGVTLPSKGN